MTYRLLRAGIDANAIEGSPNEVLQFAAENQLTCVAWSSKQISIGDLAAANKIAGDSASPIASPMLYQINNEDVHSQNCDTILFTVAALNCPAISAAIDSKEEHTTNFLKSLAAKAQEFGKLVCIPATSATLNLPQALVAMPNIRFSWQPDNTLSLEENCNILTKVLSCLYAVFIPSTLQQEEFTAYKKILCSSNQPYYVFLTGNAVNHEQALQFLSVLN